MENRLKTVSMTDDELRVANYIVLFGGRDLEWLGSKNKNQDGSIGEFFTDATEIESSYTKAGVFHVDWEHGKDPDEIGNDKDAVLGYVDWKTAHKDEKGWYVERVLNRRAKYMEWLSELIEAGLVGNSSEAISEQVVKKANGEIERWPLHRDTLTVQPMEPRMMSENALAAAKALGIIEKRDAQDAPKDEPQAEQETAVSDGGNGEAAQTNEEKAKMSDTVITEVKNVTMTPDELMAMVQSAAEKAAEKVRAAEPAAPDTSGTFVVVVDEADRPFKSIAEQCKAVKDFEISKGRSVDPRLTNPAIKGPSGTGASEGVPAEGGFLLAPTLVAEVLKPLHEEGPYSRMVRKLPVSSDSNYGWINGIDETSRATGSRYGGMRGYRLAEGATITASKPQFRRINWELKKYAVLVYATDELLKDTSQFSAIVQQGAAEELSFMANDDILNGLGVGGPYGILNSGCLVSTAAETGQAAATIINENLIKMWQQLHPRHRANAAWFINSECEPQLDLLSIPSGTAGLEPRYVTYGSDGIMRIKGRPVMVTEFNAALGTVGDILLADMSQYLFWEKGGVDAAASIHLQFLTDETVFRFIYRCDGQTALASAITPYKGSNDQSPFVALATRS